jgi:hypothetical protein
VTEFFALVGMMPADDNIRIGTKRKTDGAPTHYATYGSRGHHMWEAEARMAGELEPLVVRLLKKQFGLSPDKPL